MFDLLTHADWSIAANKRWMSTARRRDGRWYVEGPRPVSDCTVFVSEMVAPEPDSCRRLIGFDFPIGVPQRYGARTGFRGFREFLENVGSGEWNEFFVVAETPNEVSLRRPFYPRRSSDGGRRSHLLEALEVGSTDELLRQCERRTASRRAACALFWTLGAQQVGKAAITGWRDVVRPALAKKASLWPYDGALRDLSLRRGTTICETYPAESYSHVGIVFEPGESKQRQADRASKAAAIFAWAVSNNVVLSEATRGAVENGFGPKKSGEDPFDALAGLLGMIEVVSGRRSEGPVGVPAILRWEGWIMGQSS